MGIPAGRRGCLGRGAGRRKPGPPSLGHRSAGRAGIGVRDRRERDRGSHRARRLAEPRADARPLRRRSDLPERSPRARSRARHGGQRSSGSARTTTEPLDPASRGGGSGDRRDGPAVGCRGRVPDRHPGRRRNAHGGRRIDRLAERAGRHRGVVGARRPDRRARPGRASARRGREPARPGRRRPGAHRQGLRARRVRQSAAGQALAHAHVSRERPCARAQPLAGSRARGIRHHARAPGGCARAGGRDGRRHHRRGRAARAPHAKAGRSTSTRPKRSATCTCARPGRRSQS